LSPGHCFKAEAKKERRRMKKVERPEVREGYSLWSETYDATPNPLVSLDRRVTLSLLDPKPDECVVDAACGTGQHLRAIAEAGGRPIGLDFSRAMLRVARQRVPRIPLVYSDLDEELPFLTEDFEAILCALVGEHLRNLPVFFRNAFAALKPEGRLVFSVFHPAMVQAGIESNFERSGVEYRLGAQRHTVGDYLNAAVDAGFGRVNVLEFHGDTQLVEEARGSRSRRGRRASFRVELILAQVRARLDLARVGRLRVPPQKRNGTRKQISTQGLADSTRETPPIAVKRDTVLGAGEERGISSVLFSPDGKTFVTAGPSIDSCNFGFGKKLEQSTITVVTHDGY
jgi:SAM-dependent methyltransferase